MAMLHWFFLFSLQFYSIDALKILLFCPGLSRSHMIFNYRLASTLISQGHDVIIHTTVLYDGAIGSLKPPSHIREIRQSPPQMDSSTSESMLKSRVFMQDQAFRKIPPTTILLNTVGMMHFWNTFMTESCRVSLTNRQVIARLRWENFDMALGHYLNMCPVAMTSLIGVKKFIWVSPGTYIVDSAADLMRIPTSASFIPNMMSSFTDRMHFMERVQNTLFHFIILAFLKMPFGNVSGEQKIFNQLIANEASTVGRVHVERNLIDVANDIIDTMWINGEELLDYPRPFLPGMLFTGSLEEHAKTNQLDETWLTLMNSKKGLIMFSLGTIANTSAMPMEMKQAFLDAFKNFSAYTIIWRLEGEMPGGLQEQEHIKIVNWLPQRDLLYTGQVKLFITHGGYNSLVETAQSGVPMLLLPLFGDQQGNAKRAIRHGIGLELDKGHINAHTIYQQMNTILSDQRFSQRAKKLSQLMRDKIMQNEKAIVKQLERIVSHSKWPRPTSRNLGYIQLHCIDIVMTFLAVTVCLICLVISTVRFSVSTAKRLIR